MEAQDRRVRRTQHLLSKALIALTLEKGYDAVTIRDITERADVGYTTFFRHYRAKDDLLKDVLDVVLAELLALLNSPSPFADPALIGTLLFKYIEGHDQVVRVLLESHILRQHLVTLSTRSTLEGTSPRPESPVPQEVAAHHIVSATIALIEWWLAQDMPYSAERMGTIYAELIARPTAAIAFAQS